MSIRDLRHAGLSDHDIRRRVRTGQLERVRPGLFADGQQCRELDPSARQLLHYRAFARTATVPPVFCLASAALVHGMDILRLPARLHTVSPPGQGTHNGYAPVVRHQAELSEEDVVVVHGLRTTSPERTLLDCARLLPFTDAVVLADQADAFGLTHHSLEQRLAEWAGRRGVRRAGSVLHAMDSRSESVGETLTRLLLADSHLPAPELQWTIVGRTGTYRADFAWPDHWLVLEFDGEGKYAADAAAVVRNERRREVEIQELGWTVLRVGWNDVVKRPAETLARVEVALRRPRGAQ